MSIPDPGSAGIAPSRSHAGMRASQLAALVDGVLAGPDRTFLGVAPRETAGPDHAAFLQDPRTPPGAAGVLLTPCPLQDRTAVVVDDPKLAFIHLLQHLFPETHPPGIQPGAHVDPTARLGPGVRVYPGAYIGPDVEIGEDSVILPNAVLLAGTRLGARCTVGPGAVVGHAGFGVHPTPKGLVPVPQVGTVAIGDGVGLGANTCVDRAFLDRTEVGPGTRIDNLVQVGHNCRLGRSVVIAAQAGLSGSVTLEDGAVLGGQVGIADHVHVGMGAQVGAQSGVHRDLAPRRRWLGTPAHPAELTARMWAAARELPDLLRRVRRLEQAMERLLDDRSQDGGEAGR